MRSDNRLTWAPKQQQQHDDMKQERAVLLCEGDTFRQHGRHSRFNIKNRFQERFSLSSPTRGKISQSQQPVNAQQNRQILHNRVKGQLPASWLAAAGGGCSLSLNSVFHLMWTEPLIHWFATELEIRWKLFSQINHVCSDIFNHYSLRKVQNIFKYLIINIIDDNSQFSEVIYLLKRRQAVPFFVSYRCKLNIFTFWTFGQNKQDIWLHHHLLDKYLYINDYQYDSNNQQNNH